MVTIEDIVEEMLGSITDDPTHRDVVNLATTTG